MMTNLKMVTPIVWAHSITAQGFLLQELKLKVREISQERDSLCNGLG